MCKVLENKFERLDYTFPYKFELLDEMNLLYHKMGECVFGVNKISFANNV